MYAMLTGNLPFTVEPFNIKSLYNKMMKNEMNAIPEHLSKSNETTNFYKAYIYIDLFLVVIYLNI
jgi:hypothetical protein